jgi:hypothetical protein
MLPSCPRFCLVSLQAKVAELQSQLAHEVAATTAAGRDNSDLLLQLHALQQQHASCGSRMESLQQQVTAAQQEHQAARQQGQVGGGKGRQGGVGGGARRAQQQLMGYMGLLVEVQDWWFNGKS